MPEYIKREAAKEAICLTILHDGIRDALKCNIDDIPAADVVEVRHGRWIQRGRKIYCSKCNLGVYIGTDDEGLMQDEMRLLQFCPGCGAKMDGGQDDV